MNIELNHLELSTIIVSLEDKTNILRKLEGTPEIESKLHSLDKLHNKLFCIFSEWLKERQRTI